MIYRDAEKIYLTMKELVANDEDLPGLFRELLVYAVTYAHVRAEWEFMSVEERKEKSKLRTASHNTFIDACNILSRAMAARDIDNSWRRAIGEQREAMGDFACYLHCIIGNKNR